MTTPSYAELVSAVRREGAALAAAAALGLDVAVPTCPGWTVADLLRHTGRVYRFVTEVLETRATESISWPPTSRGGDAAAYLADGLDGLVAALVEAAPDTPVWNWSTQPRVAAFWARRMAHESLIHRWDADNAYDGPHVLDVDLAIDALDELLDTIVPRLLVDHPVEGLAGTMALAATDTGERWTVKLTPDSVSVTRGAGGGDVRVAGRVSELLLLLYNRTGLDSCDVAGDVRLLQLWSERVAF